MALKKINFKELLVQKGERIALGAALGIMALMVIGFGLASALGGSSPKDNAAKLTELKTKAEQALKTSQPPADLAELPPELKALEVKEVRADWFPPSVPFFTTASQEDRKWRLPEVLAPDEFSVDLIRTAGQVYLVQGQGKDIQVGVLKAKNVEAKTSNQKRVQAFEENFRKATKQAEKAQRRIQLIGQQQPGGPDGSGGAIGPRGLGGPGGKGAGARSPQFPGGEFPGMQQREAVQSDEIKFVSLEKLKNETGKWAETNIPVRLVMVTAAFPYKAQLEEYRKKLRLSSVDELLLDQTGMRPEFTGFNV